MEIKLICSGILNVNSSLSKVWLNVVTILEHSKFIRAFVA